MGINYPDSEINTLYCALNSCASVSMLVSRLKKRHIRPTIKDLFTWIFPKVVLHKSFGLVGTQRVFYISDHSDIVIHAVPIESISKTILIGVKYIFLVIGGALLLQKSRRLVWVSFGICCLSY